MCGGGKGGDSEVVDEDVETASIEDIHGEEEYVV
jgi:hypothetical protein